MLVLSRCKDEQIVIGKNDEIIITIIEVRGGRVRLGIEAAKDLPINRKEIHERIHGGNDGTQK